MKVFETWADKALGIMVVAIMVALYVLIAMGAWQRLIEKGTG